MMQKLFGILIFFITGLGAANSQTPYSWTFTAKKVADNTYEIHCLAVVQPPWHTYSQFTPDGGPVATKFSFNKNPLYILNGDVKENGKMVVKHEEVFGVDVKYFEGSVDFVQKLKLKSTAKTNINGSVEFMVCNDQQCLPPVTKSFTIALN